MKYAPLEADALGKRRLERAVDRLLRRQHRRQRHGGDGVGDFERLLDQILQRHDARDEPRALGFLGIHHAPGEDEVHRLRLADRMREPLRAADAGNDAELDFRLSEFGVIGGDDEIALQGKLAAAAEREARDRGDHRLARRRDAVPSRGEIAEKRVGERLVRHLFDVGAGGERLVRAGDDDAADIAVGLEAVDGASEFAHQRAVERIERGRPVEPNESDPAAGLDDDIFAAHFRLMGVFMGVFPALRG